MHISSKGVELIKFYEALRLRSYYCPARKLTIGWGHYYIEKDKFKEPITVDLAEKLLQEDIRKNEEAINELVKVPLTQGQYDALVSLVFNWNIDAFSRSQGLKKLNQKDYQAAAVQFFSKEQGIVKVKGVFCKGLYNRRQAELKLWNS